MKKITIVGLASREKKTLGALRNLGIIQVEHVQKPESADVAENRKRVSVIEKAIAILEARKSRVEKEPCDSPYDTAKEIVALLEHMHHLQDRLMLINKELERIAPLGDVLPNDIALLRDKKVYAKVYHCQKKYFSLIPRHILYETVHEKGSFVYILAIGREEFTLDCGEEVEWPSKSTGEFVREAEEIKTKIRHVESGLDEQTAFLHCLQKGKDVTSTHLEFSEALAGMGREEALSFLQGFCPQTDLARLEEESRRQGWALLEEDPSEAEDVPTLIKNPRWLKIMEPVFEFLGISPAYAEYDVSFIFFVSLSIFFAMIIGDGGTGLILLALTFLFRRKFKSAPWEPFALFYFMSFMCVIWGAVTGTWFSTEKIAQLPVLRSFIIPQLYTFSENDKFMMTFCFTLGAVHLTIAHSLRIVRMFRSPLQALGQAGWILIVWTAYFLAGTLVVGKPFPPAMKYAAVAGLVLAGIVPHLGRNFIKSFFLSLTEFPFSVISAFADIVSYIRLYVVGYASFVMSVSFIEMAQGFNLSPVLKVLVISLVVVFGYALNVVLGLMAVVVHGVRLNLLEFSGHLGMTWSGRKFKPFKLRT